MVHNKWKLKTCPRCNGDLYSFYNEDFQCLQCGWVDYERIFKGGVLWNPLIKENIQRKR